MSVISLKLREKGTIYLYLLSAFVSVYIRHLIAIWPVLIPALFVLFFYPVSQPVVIAGISCLALPYKRFIISWRMIATNRWHTILIGLIIFWLCMIAVNSHGLLLLRIYYPLLFLLFQSLLGSYGWRYQPLSYALGLLRHQIQQGWKPLLVIHGITFLISMITIPWLWVVVISLTSVVIALFSIQFWYATPYEPIRIKQ